MRIEVVLKDMGEGENGAKMRTTEIIPMHTQGLNCKADVCELKDHVEEKGLNLNWLTKFGLTKKTFPASFPNCPLENT